MEQAGCGKQPGRMNGVLARNATMILLVGALNRDVRFQYKAPTRLIENTGTKEY